MLVYTLKRAAGAVCFSPEQTIDIPDELAADLLKDGAVRLVEQPVVDRVESESEPEQSERQNRKRK